MIRTIKLRSAFINQSRVNTCIRTVADADVMRRLKRVPLRPRARHAPPAPGEPGDEFSGSAPSPPAAGGMSSRRAPSQFRILSQFSVRIQYNSAIHELRTDAILKNAFCLADIFRSHSRLPATFTV